MTHVCRLDGSVFVPMEPEGDSEAEADIDELIDDTGPLVVDSDDSNTPKTSLLGILLCL